MLLSAVVQKVDFSGDFVYFIALIVDGFTKICFFKARKKCVAQHLTFVNSDMILSK